MIISMIFFLGILSFFALAVIPLGYSLFLSFYLNKPWSSFESDAPDISVILPVHNEEKVITEKIKNTLDLGFPGAFEIIVVDDGSTDETYKLVEKHLEDNKIKLVKKERRGGKPSAIMEGVARAHHDLLLLTDADAYIEEESVIKLLGSLRKDVGAVTGRVVIDNRDENFITRAEGSLWEYADLVCRSESNLDSIPRVFGPLAIVRKELVSIPKESLLDDMEIGINARRKGFKSGYVPEARVHIKAPGSLMDEAQLRSRYFKGYLQLINRYKGLLFNPHFGFFGMLILPRHLLFEALSPLLLAFGTASFIILSIIEGGDFLIYLALGYLMILASVVLTGFILFIREKPLKESISHSLNMVFFVISLQFYRVIALFRREKPTWERLGSTR